MRIAYLLTDQGIPFLGSKGASVHARAITSALAGLGHDVTCYVAAIGHESPPPEGPRIRTVTVDPLLADLVDGVIARSASSGKVAPADRDPHPRLDERLGARVAEPRGGGRHRRAASLGREVDG